MCDLKIPTNYMIFLYFNKHACQNFFPYKRKEKITKSLPRSTTTSSIILVVLYTDTYLLYLPRELRSSRISCWCLSSMESRDFGWMEGAEVMPLSGIQGLCSMAWVHVSPESPDPPGSPEDWGLDQPR